MSDDGPETKRRLELTPTNVVGLLFLGLAGGGGLGSAVTGNGMETQIRELRGELAESRAELGEARAEILGEIARVSDKVDDQGRRLTLQEHSLRDHEKTPAHATARAQLQDLVRRVETIERRSQ